MKDYKKLNLPLLTKQEEEYKMLYDVAEEISRQKTEKPLRKNLEMQPRLLFGDIFITTVSTFRLTVSMSILATERLTYSF